MIDIKKKNKELNETSKFISQKFEIKLKMKRNREKKKTKPKKSNAEFLIDTIVKTYWTNKWKQQLIAIKYSRTGFNKKRRNFGNHGLISYMPFREEKIKNFKEDEEEFS